MMTPYEKNNLVNALKKALEEAQKMPCMTACPWCVSFDFGVCKKWKEAIPALTLDVGCEEWKFNEDLPPF